MAVVARHAVDRGDSNVDQEEGRRERWDKARWELGVRYHLFVPAQRQFLLGSGSCFEGMRCGSRQRMTRHSGPGELRWVSRRICNGCIRLNTDIGSIQELASAGYTPIALVAGGVGQLTAEDTRSSRIAMIDV